MKTVRLLQGTPEWHAHRAQHLNASDAPAMLGCNPYTTRSQLVREAATGVTLEVDEATQRRLDEGHRAEALARPLAEQIAGDELYPCVGTEGKYSASFDGLTLLEDTAFEHKSLNDTLRASMVDGCTGADLPKHYRVQMEQQCLVSGAVRVLFMASKWAGEELVEERHCWYTPDPALRAEILAGWEQFETDVAAYEPEAPAALVPTGRAPETLPALSIQVTGMVTASNLAEFKANAMAVLDSINRDLQTDDDFASAEKAVGWCKGVEERIEATKQQVLGQTADIDAVFRTMDDVSAKTREIRLELDKLVAKRKEERRTEIGNNARRAVQDHVRAINETLGEHALAVPATLISDLQAAIKGKRSFASMQDAVDAVAANAKITASQAADRIRANVAILAEHQDHAHLFADRVALCASKAPDDLRNLVAARVSDYERAEDQRREQERERIRQEEADKLAQQQREEAERIERERAQASQESTTGAEASAAAEPVATAPKPVAPVAMVGAAPVPAGATYSIGQINEWIAPLSINADGLASLGFRPTAKKGASKLFAADDFPHICGALARLIAEAPARAAQKKAA